MKNVQISQDLFCDLILYHLYNNPSAEEAIRRELSRKLDSMFQHESSLGTKSPQPKPNVSKRGSVTSKASGCPPTSVGESVRSPPLTGA